MTCRPNHCPNDRPLKLARRLFHTCILLSLLPESAHAGILFSSGTPDYQDGHGSDFDVFVSFGRQFYSQVAEDFSLNSGAGPITGVTWWGDYTTASAPPPVDDFTIRIFGGTNGIADALPLISLDVGDGNRQATGSTIAGSLPAYEYSATISPLSLSPNTTYWLSIVDDTRADSTQNFYWATSHWTHGDGLIRNGGDGTAWRFINPGFGGAEQAFELTGGVVQTPEPTSLVLYGMGFILFGCHRMLRGNARFGRTGAELA